MKNRQKGVMPEPEGIRDGVVGAVPAVGGA